MGDNSPVGRFSPAPGIASDRTDRRTAIQGTMELFGPEATGARAQSIAQAINSTWTATFPDGHTVSCSVKIRLRKPSDAAGNVAQIEAVKLQGPLT